MSFENAPQQRIKEFSTERLDQRYADELFREWMEHNYQDGASDYRMKLTHALIEIYEPLSNGAGQRYEHDQWEEGREGWNHDTFFKSNVDGSGRWELKPDMSVDEKRGRMSLNVHVHYIPVRTTDERGRPVDGAPEREDDFHISLQASPEQISESSERARKTVEKKQKDAECQQLFGQYAEKHLGTKITYDQALKDLNGRADVLDWAMVGDSFEIRDKETSWELVIYRENGELWDIIYRPKEMNRDE